MYFTQSFLKNNLSGFKLLMLREWLRLKSRISAENGECKPKIVEVVVFGEPAEGIVVVFGEFFKEEALVSVMQKLKQ